MVSNTFALELAYEKEIRQSLRSFRMTAGNLYLPLESKVSPNN